MIHSVLGSMTRASVTGAFLLASSSVIQSAPCTTAKASVSPIPATAAVSANEATMLAGKAKYYARMAAYYRRRALAHPYAKHEITWLTLANRCDQEAARYHRLAAREAAS
ncbi:MAG: hypothetical protein ACYDAE_00540 [Steroidobacteraceae bacterium]